MGASLRPSQGLLWTQILVNIFYVVEPFYVDKRRGFWAKIEGSWAKIGASGVNIGALVPTAQNVFKLFGPLGATLRQAQGPLRTGILVNSFFLL